MTSVPAPVDLRAHLVEHAPELFDLGLSRAVHERRAALSERRGHHEVFGTRHRGQVEADLSAPQAAAAARALGDDVARARA